MLDELTALKAWMHFLALISLYCSFNRLLWMLIWLWEQCIFHNSWMSQSQCTWRLPLRHFGLALILIHKALQCWPFKCKIRIMIVKCHCSPLCLFEMWMSNNSHGPQHTPWGPSTVDIWPCLISERTQHTNPPTCTKVHKVPVWKTHSQG